MTANSPGAHRPCLLRLPSERRRQLSILFLAKWAASTGAPDSQDGTHSTYHAEIRDTLMGLGYEVHVATRYEQLIDAPPHDFLFTLLNRGGFLNSEMLAPLLEQYAGRPYLGATPILRGLGDDKHLTKLVARSRGLDTPDWAIYRRGNPVVREPDFAWQRLIVKPNASSASWGIGLFDSWEGARQKIAAIHDEGHDAIVENFIDGFEVGVPIIGAEGPLSLPILKFTVADALAVRTYEQKRHLTASEQDEVVLSFLDDAPLIARLRREAKAMMHEYWPSDICRLEFKYDAARDRLHFIEINLSCNLWSVKATGHSFANAFGLPHECLIESILVHSMLRQGVVSVTDVERVPLPDSPKSTELFTDFMLPALL